MDIFSTNFSLTYIWYIKQHCEYHCHNSKHEYVCSLWMTWKWQKKKKNSLKPKNQYIVPFNLLITWSSLRSKPLWRYMMLWGNLNNCIEILKCCVWKLILELFVTSRSEDFFFFFPKLNFTYVFIHKIFEGLCNGCFICSNHWVADILSRYFVYNIQLPAQHEHLINIFQMKMPSIHVSNTTIVSWYSVRQRDDTPRGIQMQHD